MKSGIEKNHSERPKPADIITIMTASAFVIIMAVIFAITPDKDISVTERRHLAVMPELNAASVLNGDFMSEFEEYASDQFPQRELWRKLKAFTAIDILGMSDDNDIYEYDGFAANMEYSVNTESLDYSLKSFNYIYDSYLCDNGCNVYASVIPDKNIYLSAKSGHLSWDYDKFANAVMNSFSNAEYIDIAPLLDIDDYYCTDIHWKQENIADIAQYLASRMGTTISSSHDLKTASDTFHGVYSGQYPLNLGSDSLYYLTNDIIDSYSVYDYETGSYIPVYDLSACNDTANGTDPYSLFLGGSKAVIRIDNPHSTAVTMEEQSERNLIIFRDSFASSLAPLLAEGYSTVTLIDIRYVSPAFIGRFAEFKNTDVLFLYSTSVLNNNSVK